MTFVTVVPDVRGSVAVMYWARSNGFAVPLRLIDLFVGQLFPDTWGTIARRLEELSRDYHTRMGCLGGFVEGEVLTQHANFRGLESTVIPLWLTTPGYWPSLTVAATAYVRDGSVEIVPIAAEAVKRQASEVLNFDGGPRPERATVPAFLYGIAIGLDPAAAREPNQLVNRRDLLELL